MRQKAKKKVSVNLPEEKTSIRYDIYEITNSNSLVESLQSFLDYDRKLVSSFSEEERLCFQFYYSFAKLLKARRKELNWTQEFLAKKSHVNRVTISKIERFQQTASIDIVLRLLQSVDYTLGFFRSDYWGNDTEFDSHFMEICKSPANNHVETPGLPSEIKPDSKAT